MQLHKYNWILWCYFLTETLFFSIGGGNFRYYFFVSIIICFVYIRNFKAFTTTSVFRWQMLLVIIMIISGLASDNIKGAFASTVSCVLYMLTGVAIGALILCGNYTIYSYYENIKKIVAFIVLFGLIQYVVFKLTGIALTYQGAGQLVEGQIPGLSIEANGHGKIVGFALVLTIPVLINSVEYCHRRWAKYVLAAAVITMVLSITRMALYGFLITFFIMLLYYSPNIVARKRIVLILVAAMGLVGIVLFLLKNNIIEIGSYSMAKLEKLFDLDYESVSTDYSGATRVKIIEGSIQAWLSNVKTFFIGNGQGQAYITDSVGNTFRVAAIGIVSILPSIGIIGEIAYVGMLLTPIHEAYKAAKVLESSNSNKALQVLAEQTIFIGIYVFTMDFFSSTYVYAIMWIYIAFGYFWAWYNQGVFQES